MPQESEYWDSQVQECLKMASLRIRFVAKPAVTADGRSKYTLATCMETAQV